MKDEIKRIKNTHAYIRAEINNIVDDVFSSCGDVTEVTYTLVHAVRILKMLEEEHMELLQMYEEKTEGEQK